jgi:hypothetical protein
MKSVKDGELSSKDGNELIDYYESQIGTYTYLSPNGSKKEAD